MDPSDLIKHGAEVAKAGALAAGAAIPFTGVIKSILGPASDEIAERIRDEVRLYRFSRQVKLLKKAETMAHDAGFPVKSVPIKLLFPLLEGASLEENEDLHDMWAALLANASSDLTSDLVRPSFCELLKNMTPDVAYLLNAEFEYAMSKLHPVGSAKSEELGIELEDPKTIQERDILSEIQAITRVDLQTYRHMYRRFTGRPEANNESDDASRHRFEVAMDELHRMQMWNLNPKRSSGDHYYFSSLAAQFVTVCRQPKQKNP